MRSWTKMKTWYDNLRVRKTIRNKYVRKMTTVTTQEEKLAGWEVRWEETKHEKGHNFR